MNIQSIGSGIDRSIMEMGNLLKDMAASSTGLQEKMMEVSVAEQVSNSGMNLDILA